MDLGRTTHFLAIIMAAALTTEAGNAAWSAEKKYGPGVTDTEIKIGQTIAYSGPASSFGTIGHTISAYYRMINDRGGINGRKINFISADDGYSPPKTVEQTRRLVEQEQVLAIVGSLGSPTNASVQRYLNDRKVPQLFLFTGAARFRDPQTYPWTMAGDLSFVNETRAFARFVIEDKPDAKIGILYQNDDYGKDHINGLKSGLGDKAASMIVAEVPYEFDRPDGQLADRPAQGVGGRCAGRGLIAEIRRPIDPQGLRHRLEAIAHRQLSGRLHPADLAARRARQIGRSRHRRLSQGAR